MIAEKIKQLRKSKRLTQDELAVKLNIGRPRLGAWEEGRAEPSLAHLKLMIDLFEVNDVYGFLFGERVKHDEEVKSDLKSLLDDIETAVQRAKKCA